MEDPKIWDDAKRAQELGREKKSLENIVLVLEEVQAGLNDGRELFDMGKEDGDEETLLSVEADTRAPASWKSRPAPAVPKPRTGPRCYCACT